MFVYMIYKIWNTEVINGVKVNFCVGDYSENLYIMVMVVGGKILDVGDGSYRFIDKVKYESRNR